MRDPAWSVYALGDLAPGFFERCSWHATESPALALLYCGFTPPVLFTLGQPAAIAMLLDELAGEPAFYLHVRPEIVPVLAANYRVTGLKKMWRMLLDRSCYRPVAGPDVVRLRPADLASVEQLYSDGQSTGEAPDFFFPPMLEAGVFFGVREGDELVSVAGTH